MKKYFLKSKGLLLINIILIVIFALINVYSAFVLKNVVDVGTNGTTQELVVVMGWALLYLVASLIFSYLRMAFQAGYIRKTLLILKDDVFNKFLGRSIKAFNEENSAQYISTLTNDIGILEQDYFINLLQIFYYIVSFAIATFAIIKLSIPITIGVFSLSVFPIVIPILFGKVIGMRKKGYSDSLGNYTSKIKDIFSGFEVIKSFNIEEKIKGEYRKSNYETENSKYKFSLISSLVESIADGSGFLMFLAAMGIGTYFVIKGSITVGAMIAAIQLMNNIVNPIVMISTRLNKIKSVKLIEEKLLGFLKEDSTQDEGMEKVTFVDSLIFEGVEFNYQEDKKALNKIDLTVKKGNKYAIVGGSGSGKSTILKLLLRYYDSFNGRIKIDGIDNREIKVSSLYKLISIIQQNVFMFDSSIRDNIALYQNYTDEEVTKAIEQSGLETLVNSLPDNINSSVGENGCNLSGGEKQRIAIARALIKNTPILVLDEATSSLDNETSYNIEKSILDIEKLTCLVVTHKLIDDMLRKYNGIIVVNNGRIEEIGTFDELIINKGYFYSLYNVSKDTDENINYTISSNNKNIA